MGVVCCHSNYCHHSENRRNGINPGFCLQMKISAALPSLGNFPPYNPLQGPGFYGFKYVLLDFKVLLHGCSSFPAPPSTLPHPPSPLLRAFTLLLPSASSPLLLQDSVPAAHPLGSPPLTIPLHNLHAFLDFAAEPNL